MAHLLADTGQRAGIDGAHNARVVFAFIGVDLRMNALEQQKQR
ncbi:hypothetical protein [Salinisphaera sp. LB1]|nr:hypothetical protein [Salinisphaera sp. LB1]